MNSTAFNCTIVFFPILALYILIRAASKILRDASFLVLTIVVVLRVTTVLNSSAILESFTPEFSIGFITALVFFSASSIWVEDFINCGNQVVG